MKVKICIEINSNLDVTLYLYKVYFYIFRVIFYYFFDFVLQISEVSNKIVHNYFKQTIF